MFSTDVHALTISFLLNTMTHQPICTFIIAHKVSTIVTTTGVSGCRQSKDKSTFFPVRYKRLKTKVSRLLLFFPPTSDDQSCETAWSWVQKLVLTREFLEFSPHMQPHEAPSHYCIQTTCKSQTIWFFFPSPWGMAEEGWQTVRERKRDTNNFVNVKQRKRKRKRKKNTSATAQVLRVSGCVNTKLGAAVEPWQGCNMFVQLGALELM